MTITVDRFLDGVKRRITIPSNQQLLEDNDILNIADDKIRSNVVPLLISMRQDFFVYKEDIATVSGQKEYDIPYRAVGRTLRDIKYKDSTESLKRDLTLITIEDEHIFKGTTQVHSFYFYGDKVVIIATPDSSNYFLEMWYYMKRSNLITLSGSGKVTNISANVITVDKVPSTFSVGASIDFISGKSGSDIKAFDKVITNVSGMQLTFAAADIPSSLAVGDYIALSEQTPVLPLPDAVYTYLETLTAQTVCQAIGDFESHAILEKDLKKEMDNIKVVMQPRIVGENTLIINRSSLLRGRRNIYSRGFL